MATTTPHSTAASTAGQLVRGGTALKDAGEVIEWIVRHIDPQTPVRQSICVLSAY
jgi:hypothetical protein